MYHIRREVPKNCFSCKFNERCISYYYGGLGCTFHTDIKKIKKEKEEKSNE